MLIWGQAIIKDRTARSEGFTWPVEEKALLYYLLLFVASVLYVYIYMGVCASVCVYKWYCALDY